jgi:hypothetical protein
VHGVGFYTGITFQREEVQDHHWAVAPWKKKMKKGHVLPAFVEVGSIPYPPTDNVVIMANPFSLSLFFFSL